MILTVKYIVQKLYTPSFQDRINVVIIINMGGGGKVNEKYSEFSFFSFCLSPCNIYTNYIVFLILILI